MFVQFELDRGMSNGNLTFVHFARQMTDGNSTQSWQNASIHLETNCTISVLKQVILNRINWQLDDACSRTDVECYIRKFMLSKYLEISRFKITCRR